MRWRFPFPACSLSPAPRFFDELGGFDELTGGLGEAGGFGFCVFVPGPFATPDLWRVVGLCFAGLCFPVGFGGLFIGSGL